MKTVACRNFEEWKAAVKVLLSENVHPFDVQWLDKTEKAPFRAFKNLFSKPHARTLKTYRVERRVAELAELISCHRDFKKWDLMYSVVWRSLNGEADLLDASDDAAVKRLMIMARQVKRDIRRMKCRVHFHASSMNPEGVRAAWYEPKHFILEKTASFFKKYNSSFKWHLYTPQGSACWDGKKLTVDLKAPDLSRTVESDLILESLDRSLFHQVHTKLQWVMKNNPFLDEASLRSAVRPLPRISEFHDLCA